MVTEWQNFDKYVKIKGLQLVLGKCWILKKYWVWGDCSEGYVTTTESFVFVLDNDKLERSKVSYVVDQEHAIYEHPGNYPCFNNDLHFGGLCDPYARKG